MIIESIYVENQQSTEHVTLDPKDVELHKSSRFARSNKYYVSLGTELDVFEINKRVYYALIAAKIRARAEKKFLRIDIDNIVRGKHKNSVEVVTVGGNDSTNCVICMEEARTILFMPCRHLCACKKCSLKIDDRCPICRNIIQDKQKVFW